MHTTSYELYQSGTPVIEIPDDIDGDTRSLTTPCIGADEFLPSAYDAYLIGIAFPQIECGLGLENVQLLIRNIGISPISGINAYYEVDLSGTPVTEVIAATIQPGDSLIYTFTASYDFSPGTGDTIFALVASIFHINDTNYSNDSVSSQVTSGFVPPAPIVSDVYINGGENTNLTATTTYPVTWYDDVNSVNPVYYGIPYTVGPMWETTTYWTEVHPLETSLNCPSSKVPLTIYVAGQPDIVVQDSCLNFEPILQWTSSTKSFYIGNLGSYTLNIDSLTNSLPVFTLSGGSNSVIPGDSTEVTVTFNPVTVGLFSDTIWIFSNDVDTFVCLTAEALDPPEYSSSPDSVYHLVSCFDTLCFPLTIYNSGLGLLSYDFQINQLWTYSSIIYITTSGEITTHSFNNIGSYADSVDITITINGDYNSTSEYIDIYVDGDYIGTFQGGYTYTDLTITYTVSGAQLLTWMADGSLVVQIDNSSSVDPGYTDLNRVDIVIYGQDWIVPSVQSGTINPLSNQVVDVCLISSNLNSGIYNNIITVNTNDPLNPADTVIVYMEVVGTPEIAFSNPCMDLGSQMEWTSTSQDLTIYNDGCDTLFIDSILNTLSEYTFAQTNYLILPGDSDILTVQFLPTAVMQFIDTLEFFGNFPDTIVCLTGTGLGSPTISSDNDSISISVTTCCDTVTVPVTIYNTGAVDLIFELGGIGQSGSTGSSLVDVINNLNTDYLSITSSIPNRFDFSDGITGTYISDGINDMYDGGNYLSTNLGSYLNYSDNVIQNSAIFGGTAQNYFTRKYPGLFVMVADLNGVSDFSISGNLGADGSGNIDATILTLNVNGITYLGFVKRVYNAYDPSVNHLVIVQANTFLNHTYSADTDNDQHDIHGLNNSNRIYYLLYASVDGGYIDDNATLLIMQNFLVAADPTPPWIYSDLVNDTVAPGDSTLIDLYLTSCLSESGVFNVDVYFYSNDPLNQGFSIPVEFSVDGVPTMVVTDTCLNFGTIMQWTTESQYIEIENTGCDTLWIYDINSSLAVYEAIPSSLFVLPGETEIITVTFSPETNDSFIDTLNILSNDGNISLCLTGYALGAPIVGAYPGSFDFTLNSFNDTLTSQLAIYNIGLSDLTFELSPVAQAGISTLTSPKVVLITPNLSEAQMVRTELVSTGVLTIDDIDIIAAPNPLTTAMLDGYSAALVWTNSTFANSTAIGDTLKKFVDNGGGVILGTYALSNSWGIYGGIFDPGYCPFAHSGSVSVSGIININNLPNPNHPIFDNINGNINYWWNSNYSNTPLNTWGILLAQDTNGNNVVAENENGNVIGINIHPSELDNCNAETKKLFANALLYVSTYVDWISFSLDTDTLGILDTSTVVVTFNTTGMTNGQYIANINIASNDPLSPQLLLPCTLNINSDPIIDINPDCISFDPIMQWTTAMDSFIVYNYGCDTLTVSNIANSLTEYTLDKTSFDVLPGDMEIVTVSFHPSSIGNFYDTIIIFNNDHDTTICLSGEGFGAPVISTDPGQLSFSLNNCDEVVSDQITIYNTGTEDLIWDMYGGYGNNFDSTQTQYYSYSGATTQHSFNPGFSSDSLIVIVTVNGDFDAASEYVTVYIDGQNLGQIIDNNVTNGTDIVAVYHLGGQNVLNWLQDGIVNVSVVNSSAVDHWAGLISKHQVQLTISGVEWLNLSSSNGVIAIGDSAIIDVFATGTGLITGNYTANIQLGSNDPLNPLIIIPVDVTLTGYPIIELSQPCITIDSVMTGITESEILTIFNTGCDTLFVTSLTNQLAEFSTDLNSFFILPGFSEDVTISFTSGGISVYYDTIHIFNNDVDTFVCLVGTGIGIPVLDINPDPLIVNVTGCSVPTGISLYIGNDGSEDLEWYSSDISSNKVIDDFDPGIDATQWSSISGGTAYGSCGVVSGTNALYFNGSGIRDAITFDMETQGGGLISFYIRIGTGSFPCENADGGEDVVLQYSNDGGLSWTNIAIFYADNYPSWTYIEEEIPAGAQSASTRFRWYQVSHSGSGYDNWSIDDVLISGSSFSLDLSVNSGIVTEGDSAEVIVTIDPSGLNAGVYNANLYFTSNDPYALNTVVPVILNINMTTLVANAGPDDTLSLGSSLTLQGSAIGGNSPYLYFWEPVGDLNASNISNPIASPVISKVFTLTVEDATGCISVDEMYIHVMHSISGQLTYLNSNNEPISGSWSILKNSSGNKLDSVITDANGNYLFEGVENGNYFLGANIPITWDGGNATDALLIRRHVVMLQALSGLPLSAADVNASSTITSFDALYVLRRTIGYTSGFPAGDWSIENAAVTINNNNAVVNYSALCYGDVNGTYILNPTKSVVPTVKFIKEGEMVANGYDIIDIPVYIQNAGSLGAITLFMSYSVEEMEIVELVNCPDNMIYKDYFGVLKIAWEDVNPLITYDNSELFRLRVLIKDHVSTSQISSLPESEFSDEYGNIYQDVKLIVPEIKTDLDDNEFYMINNHPNPFRDFTTIEYYIPDDGRVILEVNDVLGRSVGILVNSYQSKGKYNAVFNGANLSIGAYVCKITYIKGPERETRTQIMHLIR